jgi:hypothetical protein
MPPDRTYRRLGLRPAVTPHSSGSETTLAKERRIRRQECLDQYNKEY